MKRSSQSGVALVITLILLSIITFMAITFIVVSRRERGAVSSREDQQAAKEAAEAALARAQGQIAAAILSYSNGLQMGLMVPTNYINPRGYAPGGGSITNVSYSYQNGQTINNTEDLLIMLSNLQIDPRAPVFVPTTNALVNTTNGLEFRYYLDLNRNYSFDPTGYQPFFDKFDRFLGSDYLVGDPQWIGMLDNPDLPHSGTNRFLARCTYLVVPIGNSLDINYIGNEGKQLGPGVDGFSRDEGVGPWEINLPAFLHDLNTNEWGGPGAYSYNTNVTGSSSGAAFSDALGILRYRYNGSYTSLANANALFPNGANQLVTGLIDDYGIGQADTAALLAKPWSGADNPTHFFSDQDLFNQQQSAFLTSFSNRLAVAGQQVDTYDNKTFYRLLSQMGSDSAPDVPGSKINLNYVNVGGLSASNLVRWTIPVQFFTNVANALLNQQFGPGFTTANFPGIPVYVNSNFVYSSSINRLLQLAANIYDCTTNRTFANGSPFPSVFQPLFNIVRVTDSNGGVWTNVYIKDYVEVQNFSAVGNINFPPYAIPDDLPQLMTSSPGPTNIYGVPIIFGARKGLPNFNKFISQTVSQITRKVEVVRQSIATPISQFTTNQMYLIGASNNFGIELWNSYLTPTPRTMGIFGMVRSSYTVTNNFGFATNILINCLTTNNLVNGIPTFGPLQILTNNWPGFPYNPATYTAQTRRSMQFPLEAQVDCLPDSQWNQTPPYTLSPILTNREATYQPNTGFPAPEWGLSIKQRVMSYIVDSGTGRLIDCVLLDGIGTTRDLTTEMPGYNDPNYELDNSAYWSTNRLGSQSILNPTIGVLSQLGMARTNDYFMAFFGLGQGQNNSLSNEAPFSPTYKTSQTFTWDANDPMVHYMSADLTDLMNRTNGQVTLVPPNTAAPNSLTTLTNYNTLRYLPWQPGGNGNSPNNIALQDPMITRSDDWQFPSNLLANIGQLGQVHRGTPWQTIYLKSTPVDPTLWQTWTGNTNINFAPLTTNLNFFTVYTNLLVNAPLTIPYPVGYFDSLLTQPTNDWKILDLFTTAISDNESRGQLSVNQTNYAAWSAVLSGVVAWTNNTPDGNLSPYNRVAPPMAPYVIDPAGDANSISLIVSNINVYRTLFPGGVFGHVGDILSVPNLTVASPILNTDTTQALQGLTDAAYERIPQQIMSLLKVGSPRFVIFAWGQGLRPAPGSIYQFSGLYTGLCTNYQVSAEYAIRAVVRFDNYPLPPNANPQLPTLPAAGTSAAWFLFPPGALNPQVIKAPPPQMRAVIENVTVLQPE